MSEDRFKVSVAMCTYNGAAFLDAQLESILGQTRCPDEIIISDDGSTDATLEIANKFAAQYPSKIQIVKNHRPRGSCGNFENAISIITGDIIFLADFDDVWFPEKVSTMLQSFAEKPEIVLAYSDAVLTDRELNPTGTMFARRKAANLRKAPNLSELSRGVAFNGPMIAFHSRLKPFVIPISPLSMQWAHDHWIGFIAYAVGEIAVIDRPLVYYRRHGENEGGDAELDGGLRYQWRVVKKKHSSSKAYSEKRRGWEDMVSRLREIKRRELPLSQPSKKLDDLLLLSERCLQFASARQSQKAQSPLARAPGAFRLLATGDYHRYARGFKTFIQDLIIR